MAGRLIRYDLSLPYYFTYPPAPTVNTRAMIPRQPESRLYIRGEFGIKPDGKPRPISAHNTTHLDAPYHFDPGGEELAGILNNGEFAGDRPCLARVVWLGGEPALPGAFIRDGVTYCEGVGSGVLPGVDELKDYEALVLLTGFGRIMEVAAGEPFTPATDGAFHLPYLQPDAVELILAAGLSLVAIDSNTVEPQTSIDPLRFGSQVHLTLLGHRPPVLIVEGLGGGSLEEKVGFMPAEALLQMVPRRVNEIGADAAHSRALLYFYRGDDQGSALRELAEMMTPEEYYG